MGVVGKIITKCGKVAMDFIDIRVLENMGVKNIRRINSRCISGSTFDCAHVDINKIKEAGINRIIDFRSEAGAAYKELCEKAGLEYINFPMFSTSRSMRGPSLVKVDEEYFKELKRYLSLVEDGKNTYIGCQYGLDRTNIGVMINYLLNPKAPVPKILSWDLYDKKSLINNLLNSVRRKVIKKLTPEQLKELGIPEDYAQYLQHKIAELMKENVYQFQC